MIDDLLLDLTASGWTISWAYQSSPSHWRLSIIQLLEWNGCDQPDYLLSHCADAPTFAEALEDAMSRRAEAELIEGQQTSHTQEPPALGLIAALGIRRQAAAIRRRI